MNLERNVGGVDRMIRIGAGIVLVGIAMFGEISVLWRTVSWVVAAVLFVTAIARYCPINSALSIDTSEET
ncbi:MAG: YgaP family membrane protein [Telluria sp.]